jgi:alpha-L-arabinofuranosidase
MSETVFADGARCGRVALHTWLTSAEFKDISVTAADGRKLWNGLPDPATSGAREGKWEVAGGVLRQTDATARNTALVFGEASWTDYTLKARARKLAGKEGFIIHVRERAPEQCIYANYGGWMNTAHAIETKGAYDFATPRRLDAAAFKPIETGRWYDLQVDVEGDSIHCYIDGRLDFACKSQKGGAMEGVFASTTIDDKEKMMYVKVVNVGEGYADGTLNLKNCSVDTGRDDALRLIRLFSENGTDENTIQEPRKIYPGEGRIKAETPTKVLFQVPAYSVNILKVRIK